MDTRLFSFAEQHQLPIPAQQELIELVEQIVSESLVAGRSVLKWEAAAASHKAMEEDTLGRMQELLQAPEKQDEDRYDIKNVIGVGSMGEVYRAKDKQLKRNVALKVLRSELMDEPELIARFLEEAQATSQLQHPGVIPLHDMGRLKDGRYFFTMKEVQGRTLDSVISELHQQSRYVGQWSKTHDGWTFRKLIAAFLSVCGTLAFAHAKGVIHRDLKPENIMLGSYGEVMVLDWGLVKIKKRDKNQQAPSGSFHVTEMVESFRSEADRFQTVSGAVLGTPMYMAPEQAGGGVLDARADVYALGALLYEMMAGKPPYEGDTFLEIIDKLLTQEPPPLIMTHEEIQQAYQINPYFRPPMPLHPELVAICERAMARLPEERYQDAGQLGTCLEAWLDGDEVT